jgi:hypothetical protein
MYGPQLVQRRSQWVLTCDKSEIALEGHPGLAFRAGLRRTPLQVWTYPEALSHLPVPTGRIGMPRRRCTAPPVPGTGAARSSQDVSILAEQRGMVSPPREP